MKLCLRVTSYDQPLNERTMRQLTGALDDAEDQATASASAWGYRLRA